MKNTTQNTVTPINAIVIKEPNAPATPAQRGIIGRAVIANQCRRFTDEEWKGLTEGKASEIIQELKDKYGEPLASERQKRKLLDLIRRGYRTGLKKETLETLTSHTTNLMIYHAQENERLGVKVEGYVPRASLKIGAPKTERQTERLGQLVTDGYLASFDPEKFDRMSHENASYHIRIGKAREAKDLKVANQAA